MRSMRSMRGGFIFRNRGPSLKVHHGQCLTSMTSCSGPNEMCVTVLELSLNLKGLKPLQRIQLCEKRQQVSTDIPRIPYHPGTHTSDDSSTLTVTQKLLQ
jgi:hypothetical protein